MAGAKLQIRGDVQIQLAKVGYELRRLQKEVETMTLDRPPGEEEQHLLDNIEKALAALRTAEDHAELVGFYLDALDAGDVDLADDF
jgi:hypothetical protein